MRILEFRLKMKHLDKYTSCIINIAIYNMKNKQHVEIQRVHYDILGLFFLCFFSLLSISFLLILFMEFKLLDEFFFVTHLLLFLVLLVPTLMVSYYLNVKLLLFSFEDGLHVYLSPFAKKVFIPWSEVENLKIKKSRLSVVGNYGVFRKRKTLISFAFSEAKKLLVFRMKNGCKVIISVSNYKKVLNNN